MKEVMSEEGVLLNNKNNTSKKPKLKRFNKNRKRNIIIALSVLSVFLMIGGVYLYKTYAYYTEEKKFNIIQGQVGSHWYDVKVAINVDGTEASTVPTSRKGDNGNYYSVSATCDQGSTAEWDYNAWNLVVDNINENTKCNVTFTSTLTEDDYQDYIDAGISKRRNTYRGKDITSYYTDKSLYTMISNGTFDDIYVGDYINVTYNGTTTKFLVADIDNYLYSGDTALTKHHLTMIPATYLKDAQMNSSNTTAGGYYGSAMVTSVLGTDLTTTGTVTYNLYQTFGEHLLKYRNLLSNSVSTDSYSSAGAGWKGSSNGWAWYDRYCDLMSESNVYGNTAFSSSGYDTGIDSRQYAIFQLKPELINNFRHWYWLKNVSASTGFAGVYSGGSSGGWGASGSNGVRPRFLIG